MLFLLTRSKQQLGVKKGETKMLGLPWNNREDLIAVTFPEEPVDVTKRGILPFLAAVYDLGLPHQQCSWGSFSIEKYVRVVFHGMRR